MNDAYYQTLYTVHVATQLTQRAEFTILDYIILSIIVFVPFILLGLYVWFAD